MAYTIIILPIAAARFTAWAGRDVPFEATIFWSAYCFSVTGHKVEVPFSDVIFLFSGVVNVTLFMTMRQFLPRESMTIHMSVPKWAIGAPASLPSTKESGPDSYYGPSNHAKEDEERGPASAQTVVALPGLRADVTIPRLSLEIPAQSGLTSQIPKKSHSSSRTRPVVSLPRESATSDSVYTLNDANVQSNRRWSPESRGSPETYASSPSHDREHWQR